MNLHISTKNKEFKIYFQPKYSIQGDKPVCKDAEALVRWVNPIYGLINPGKFISLYENNGLITKLDRYVFEETVKLVKMYHDKYKEKITVSINLSRVDLYDLYLKKENYILKIVLEQNFKTFPIKEKMLPKLNENVAKRLIQKFSQNPNNYDGIFTSVDDILKKCYINIFTFKTSGFNAKVYKENFNYELLSRTQDRKSVV